jgi:hypothetical protein
MNDNEKFKIPNDDSTESPQREYPDCTLIYVPAERAREINARADAEMAAQESAADLPSPQPPKSVRKRAHPPAIDPPASDAERHSRKCAVCQHPERESIDQAFVHWVPLSEIALEFRLPSRDTIRRHALATGLRPVRTRSMHHALERIIELAGNSRPSADACIRAIRAHSLLKEDGQWVEPPRHLIITHETPATYAARLAAIPAAALSPIDVSPQPPTAPSQPSLEPEPQP